MLAELKITRVARSRLPGFDVAGSVFGESFSDHMFQMVFEDGRWTRPEIAPYGPVPIEPASIALHYAQAVFEGMKAYRGEDGYLRLFRPYDNARRLRSSCMRLGIPPIDEETFVESLRALVQADSAWVPDLPDHSLYIRPIVFSTEGHIEVRPSRRYRFLVITSPVGAYFRDASRGLRLLAEEHYTRAAPAGGLGAAKAAANYAGTLLAGETAREAGFDQVLWLDGHEHRLVEEAGLMNVFFKLDGRFVTPPISDSILPGITRDSLLVLLDRMGVPAEERPIGIDELAAASERGALEEMFACGTAAVVSPIARITWREQEIAPAESIPGPVSRALYDRLTGIQFGRLPDEFGWTLAVDEATGRRED